MTSPIRRRAPAEGARLPGPVAHKARRRLVVYRPVIGSAMDASRLEKRSMEPWNWREMSPVAPLRCLTMIASALPLFSSVGA